jgi:hypothetical protein
MHFVKAKVIAAVLLKAPNTNKGQRMLSQIKKTNSNPIATSTSLGLLSHRKKLGTGLVNQQINYSNHSTTSNYKMENGIRQEIKEQDSVVKSSTSNISNETNPSQVPAPHTPTQPQHSLLLNKNTSTNNSVSDISTQYNTPHSPIDKRRMSSRFSRRDSKMMGKPEAVEFEKPPEHIPVELPIIFSNNIKTIYDVVCLIIDLKHIAKRNPTLVDNVCPVHYSATGEIELILPKTISSNTKLKHGLSRLLNSRTSRGTPRQQTIQSNPNSPRNNRSNVSINNTRKNASPIKRYIANNKNNTTNNNNNNNNNNKSLSINKNKSILNNENKIAPIPIVPVPPPSLKQINNSIEKKNSKIILPINEGIDLNTFKCETKVFHLLDILEEEIEIEEEESKTNNRLPSILFKSNSKLSKEGDEDSISDDDDDDDSKSDDNNNFLVSLLASESSEHSHELDPNDRYSRAEERHNSKKKN